MEINNIYYSKLHKQDTNYQNKEINFLEDNWSVLFGAERVTEGWASLDGQLLILKILFVIKIKF